MDFCPAGKQAQCASLRVADHPRSHLEVCTPNVGGIKADQVELSQVLNEDLAPVTGNVPVFNVVKPNQEVELDFQAINVTDNCIVSDPGLLFFWGQFGNLAGPAPRCAATGASPAPKCSTDFRSLPWPAYDKRQKMFRWKFRVPNRPNSYFAAFAVSNADASSMTGAIFAITDGHQPR